MAINQPYQQYKQNSVNTASPGELTLMLYNGCLKFIKQGKLSIIQGNIEKRHESLVKAQDIMQELMVTLNMDIEISKNLLQMYDYIYRRLIDANTNNSIEILDEVEGFVTEFRDAWKEVIQITRKQQYAGSGQA